MAERPLVRVGPYGVLGDWVRATCSRCGVFGYGAFPSDDVRVDRLTSIAYRHAQNAHDGDVDREGWT